MSKISRDNEGIVEFSKEISFKFGVSCKCGMDMYLDDFNEGFSNWYKFNCSECKNTITIGVDN